MPAPKNIRAKAEQLDKALNRVAELSSELEDWISSKTNSAIANDVFCFYSFDNPYEFNLGNVLKKLDEIADE